MNSPFGSQPGAFWASLGASSRSARTQPGVPGARKRSSPPGASGTSSTIVGAVRAHLHEAGARARRWRARASACPAGPCRRRSTRSCRRRPRRPRAAAGRRPAPAGCARSSCARRGSRRGSPAARAVAREHPGRRVADALRGDGREPVRVAAAGRADVRAAVEPALPVGLGELDRAASGSRPRACRAARRSRTPVEHAGVGAGVEALRRCCRPGG